jgi:putative peptidoglycan lipid II flippase
MLGQVVAANVVMVAFLWALAGSTERWIAMPTWHRVGWMSVLVCGGALLYFGTLYALGMRVGHLRVQAPPRIPPPPASPDSGA